MRYEITTEQRDNADTMHPLVALEMINALGRLGYKIKFEER